MIVKSCFIKISIVLFLVYVPLIAMQQKSQEILRATSACALSNTAAKMKMMGTNNQDSRLILVPIKTAPGVVCWERIKSQDIDEEMIDMVAGSNECYSLYASGKIYLESITPEYRLFIAEIKGAFKLSPKGDLVACKNKNNTKLWLKKIEPSIEKKAGSIPKKRPEKRGSIPAKVLQMVFIKNNYVVTLEEHYPASDTQQATTKVNLYSFRKRTTRDRYKLRLLDTQYVIINKTEKDRLLLAGMDDNSVQLVRYLDKKLEIVHYYVSQEEKLHVCGYLDIDAPDNSNPTIIPLHGAEERDFRFAKVGSDVLQIALMRHIINKLTIEETIKQSCSSNIITDPDKKTFLWVNAEGKIVKLSLDEASTEIIGAVSPATSIKKEVIAKS